MQSITPKIKEAFEQHKNGHVVEALALYSSLLPQLRNIAGTEKMLSTIISNAGALYNQVGDYDKAFELFKNAVTWLPDDATCHFNLALILNTKVLKQGQALKHCGIAIKLDPSYHKAYHLMGNILQDIGKPEEAVRYFKLAEEIAQGSAPSPRHENVSSLYQEWITNASTESLHTLTLDSTSWNMKCVSTHPLIFEIDDFLSPLECRHIITRAEPLLQESHVMGKAYADTSSNETIPQRELFRTSSSTWLHADDTLRDVQRRVRHALFRPEAGLEAIRFEDLQVVRYSEGQQFRLHHDSSSFHPRTFTALLYLSDNPHSGATHFPLAAGNGHSIGSIVSADVSSLRLSTAEEAISHVLSAQAGLSSASTSSSVSSGSSQCSHADDGNGNVSGTCDDKVLPSAGGVRVRPRVGKCILFFNHDLASNELDPLAVHAGDPVHGPDKDKWVANYWGSI